MKTLALLMLTMLTTPSTFAQTSEMDAKKIVVVKCTTLDNNYTLIVVDNDPKLTNGGANRFQLTMRQRGNPSPIITNDIQAEVYADKPYSDPTMEVQNIVGGGIQLTRASDTPGLSKIRNSIYSGLSKTWDEYAKCVWSKRI